MIKMKELKTLEDFITIKKNDILACEFHQNVHDYPKKPFRFGVFKVFTIIPELKEIVLQKKNNIYFNYGLYLDPSTGASNLKSAVLITTDTESK